MNCLEHGSFDMHEKSWRAGDDAASAMMHGTTRTNPALPAIFTQRRALRALPDAVLAEACRAVFPAARTPTVVIPAVQNFAALCPSPSIRPVLHSAVWPSARDSGCLFQAGLLSSAPLLVQPRPLRTAAPA